MIEIDDNKLASYFEGTLNNEERAEVEEAIEHDDMLKSIVDGWISSINVEFQLHEEHSKTDVIDMSALKSIRSIMNRVREKKVRPSAIKLIAAAVVFACLGTVGYYFLDGRNYYDDLGGAAYEQELSLTNATDNEVTEETVVPMDEVHSEEQELVGDSSVNFYGSDDYI